MDIALVLLIGLCFGSFLTLVSHRLPRGGSLVMDRSACPTCKTTLRIPDLFPLASWLINKARCRHCHTPISWRYPAIELVTALALLCVYLTHGLSPQSLIIMALTLALMVMIIVDFEHYIIPDEIQWLVLGLGIVFHWFYGMHPADMFAGGAVGGFLGWSLQAGYRVLRKRDGLGTGDVKFLLVCGVWLGAINLIPFLFFSGVLGVLTAGLWQRLHRGALFPFGPSLAMSLWMIIMWPEIANYFFTWPQHLL